MTSTMPADEIMKQWRPGSRGDDWTWGDEEADLGNELDALANQVQANGFTEPVLLGNDGRVWDGHHRILVGRMLALDVPYEVWAGRGGATRGAEMTAEDIVRRLAAIDDPTIKDRDYAPSASCGLCGRGSEESYEPMRPDHHSPDCPWIQARQWAAEHSGPGGREIDD